MQERQRGAVRGGVGAGVGGGSRRPEGPAGGGAAVGAAARLGAALWHHPHPQRRLEHHHLLGLPPGRQPHHVRLPHPRHLRRFVGQGHQRGEGLLNFYTSRKIFVAADSLGRSGRCPSP